MFSADVPTLHICSFMTCHCHWSLEGHLLSMSTNQSTNFYVTGRQISWKTVFPINWRILFASFGESSWVQIVRIVFLGSCKCPVSSWNRQYLHNEILTLAAPLPSFFQGIQVPLLGMVWFDRDGSIGVYQVIFSGGVDTSGPFSSILVS